MATDGDAVPIAQEKINTDIVTLTRFLTEEQTKHKEATGDFTHAFLHRHHCPHADLLSAFSVTPCSSPSSLLLITSGEPPLST